MENQLIGKTLHGRYVINQFIGSGAMADVYKVWDNQRSAFLALKLLHEDLAEDAVFLRRFRREGSTLEKLQHPNIVRYYGLEQEDMQAFILMDFIEGLTLRSEIYRQRGTGLSTARILEIMKPVCSALNFAHRQGFVHCDIKPSNILTHTNGTVLLTDFGISYITESSTSTNMVGAGTPGYMSPEQIHGERPQVSTDIYSLGVVLFEMMTGGERPFTGERAEFAGSVAERTRWEQTHLEPLSLTEKNPQVTPRLAAVVNRCLSVQGADRFEDTLELFNALQKALKGVQLGEDYQPVQVSKPLAPAKRPEAADPSPSRVPAAAPAPKSPAAQPPKRRGGGLLWWGLGVLLLLAVGAGAVWLLPGLLPAAAPAPSATANPPTALPPTPLPPTATLAAAASATAKPAASPTVAGSPAPTRAISTALPVAAGAKITVDTVKSLKPGLRLGQGAVEQAIWSPDGASIAVASSSGIYIYNAATLERTQYIDTSSWIKRIQYGGQGKTLISMDTTGKIAVWDIAGARQIFAHSVDRYTIFTVSPDGKYLAYLKGDSIELLNAATGDKIGKQPLCCQNGEISTLIFSPNSNYLASAGRMGVIYVWTIEYWGVYRAIEVQKVPIGSIAISPDGKNIASGQQAGDSVVHSWDIYTKNQLPSFKGDYQAEQVLYRNNDQIISAYPNGGMQVWDYKQERQVLKIDNNVPVASLAVSPDPKNQFLLVVTKDMRVRIWDLDTGKVAKSLDQFSGPITAMAPDPTGRYLAASGLPGVITLWDLSTPKGTSTLINLGAGVRIRSIKFSPDGKILAAGGDDQIVHLWDVETRQPRVISTFKTGAIYALAFDPAGSLVAAGDSQGQIVIWDVLNGSQVITFGEPALSVPIRSLKFNIDGRYLASTSDDRVLRVWDLKAEQMLNLIRLDSAVGENPPLYFGADMLAGASGNTALVWNIGSWSKVNSFSASAVGDFSPDLRFYAYAKRSNSNLAFLDLQSGAELTSYSVSAASLTQIAFSPDGKAIYIGGEDGVLQVWKLP